jgi:hypothetical protein
LQIISIPAGKYFARKVAAGAIAASVGGLFIGALRFLTQVLYGHPFLESLKPAAIYFLIAYLLIWISGSVAMIFGLLNKAKESGVTIDYISKLPVQERKDFEKQHGF